VTRRLNLVKTFSLSFHSDGKNGFTPSISSVRERGHCAGREGAIVSLPSILTDLATIVASFVPDRGTINAHHLFGGKLACNSDQSKLSLSVVSE
jgi:hypothetical protein